jgi:hypothetical protein
MVIELDLDLFVIVILLLYCSSPCFVHFISASLNAAQCPGFDEEQYRKLILI